LGAARSTLAREADAEGYVAGPCGSGALGLPVAARPTGRGTITAEPLLPFLPLWPPQLGQVGWFALMLLAATSAGEFVFRVLHLPRLLGYVASGLLLGPQVFALLDTETVRGMRPLVDLSLGLVLFELGHRLDLAWLRRNPWLLATSILEAGLAFAAVFAALRWLNVPSLYATAAAAIGMGTSPAVVVHITRELRAQGQVTERLLLLTALNSVYAVVTLAMWLAWLHFEYEGSPMTVVLHPLYLIAGSLLVALVATLAARLLPRALRTREDVELLLIVGLLVLLVEVAFALRLSVLLTLVAFGVLAKHTVGWPRVLPKHFATITAIFMVVLFAVIGASLDPGALVRLAGPAFAFAVVRVAAKTAATTLTSLPSGVSRQKGVLLGLGLAPMSGVAVVLVQDTSAIYPEFSHYLLALVLAAVTILELAGPVLTKVALVQAREAARPE
jgi:Kef-type K+ transport system membrane component KefB